MPVRRILQQSAAALATTMAQITRRQQLEIVARQMDERLRLRQVWFERTGLHLRELLNRAFRTFRVEVQPEYDILATWETASKYMQQMPLDLVEDVGRIYFDKCIEFSNVQYFSLQQLREMGYPYSIRYGEGSAGIPDYLINVQSGDYLRGWDMRVSREGGKATVEVVNTSEHAAYLSGPRHSSRMRIRPIQQAAFEATYDQRRLALDRIKARVRRAYTDFVPAGSGQWRSRATGQYERPPGLAAGTI